jgi:hypothetical protein
MPSHEEQKTLTYTVDELFAIVADVKDYPSFVPLMQWRAYPLRWLASSRQYFGFRAIWGG